MFGITIGTDKENLFSGKLANKSNINITNNVKALADKASSSSLVSKPSLQKQAAELSWADIQTKNFNEWINFAFAQKDTDSGALEQAKSMKPVIQAAMSTLCREIDSGLMTVREERDIHVDVGLHDVMCELFLSYHMRWLRIACVVVFDFTPTGTVKQFQKQLLHSLLWTDKKKVNSTHLCKHFLKKLFEFVLFLDVAKKSNLMITPLFEVKAKVKSSKDVLAVLCKEFLKGEGDIFRHLAVLNYKPDYQQNDIDEYDFKVNNIATDLRDGVRLCRLVDMLGSGATYNISGDGEVLSLTAAVVSTSSPSSLCSKLLVPALNISRKEHNVKVLLKYLFQDEKQKFIKANDIVSGNRDKTLLLLWEIFFQVKLKDLLDSCNIEMEIAAIKSGDNSASASADTSAMESSEEEENEEDAAAGASSSSAAASALSKPAVRVNPHADVVKSASDKGIAVKFASLLKEWIHTILVKVLENSSSKVTSPLLDMFSSSPTSSSNSRALFEDGSALCYLLHHYHPGIVQECDIQTSGSGTKQHNWLLFSQASRIITGIPSISADCISSKPLQDNQSLLIFLAFLFSRLQQSKDDENLARLVEEGGVELSLTPEAAAASSSSSAAASISAVIDDNAEVEMNYGAADEAAAPLTNSKKRKSCSAAVATTAPARASTGRGGRKSLSVLKSNAMMQAVSKATSVANTMSASAFIQEQRKKRKSTHTRRSSTGTFDILPDHDENEMEEDGDGDGDADSSSIVVLSKKQIAAEVAKKQKLIEEEQARIAAEEAEVARLQEEARMQQEQEQEAARLAAEEAENARIAEEEAAEQARIAEEAAAEQARLDAEEAERVRIEQEKAAAMKLKVEQQAEELRLQQEEMARQLRAKQEAKQKAAEEAEKKAAAEAAAAQQLSAKAQKLAAKREKAAVSVQSFLRGSIVRAQRKRKLSMIHANLKKATATAKSNPSQIIGARTSDAIHALKSYAVNNDPEMALNITSSSTKPIRAVTARELLDACKSLEYSTEVSKNCCKNLIRGETAGLLMHLIRTCDRSRDSQELLQHALITLLNVARYDELAYFVSQGDKTSIATIIDLLQMFRDKKGVFSIACELMCRIISADANAKATCAPSSEPFKRLQAISQIIESKYKIEQRMKALSARSAKASGRPENSLSPCKGKYLASKEPIDCIRLLMKLLE